MSHPRKETTLLNFKLNGMTNLVHMLNYGSKTLDVILGLEKVARVVKGIGFDQSFIIEENKFSPLKHKTELQLTYYMSK